MIGENIAKYWANIIKKNPPVNIRQALDEAVTILYIPKVLATYLNSRPEFRDEVLKLFKQEAGDE
jgi:hypothetical protein